MFDRVVAHARAQRIKSTNPLNGACVYRGPNGTKCFIGALIPDDKYEPRMDDENLSASSRIIQEAVGMDDSYLQAFIASKLQVIHDMHDPSSWEEKFEELAYAHDLTYTPPAT